MYYILDFPTNQLLPYILLQALVIVYFTHTSFYVSHNLYDFVSKCECKGIWLMHLSSHFKAILVCWNGIKCGLYEKGIGLHIPFSLLKPNAIHPVVEAKVVVIMISHSNRHGDEHSTLGVNFYFLIRMGIPIPRPNQATDSSKAPYLTPFPSQMLFTSYDTLEQFY